MRIAILSMDDRILSEVLSSYGATGRVAADALLRSALASTFLCPPKSPVAPAPTSLTNVRQSRLARRVHRDHRGPRLRVDACAARVAAGAQVDGRDPRGSLRSHLHHRDDRWRARHLPPLRTAWEAGSHSHGRPHAGA